MDFLTPRAWASLWHITAASMALDKPITSTYLKMNSAKEPASQGYQHAKCFIRKEQPGTIVYSLDRAT